MIMNLKKLLAKIPGGGSKIGTFAAALFLVKEEKDVYNMTNEEIEERVKRYLLSEETKQLIDEEFVVGDTVLIESHNIEGEISRVEEAWVHIQSKGQGMIAHKENVKKNQEDLLLEDEEKVAVVGKHPRTRIESRRIFKKSEMSIAQQIAKEWREKGYGGVVVKDLPDGYMEAVQEGIIIPRPSIRNKERRVIDSMLKRHKELTDRYMAQGMSKTDASAKAMQAVRGKIEEDVEMANIQEKWKSTWIDTKSTGLRGRRLKTFQGGRASAEVEWQKVVAAKKDDKNKTVVKRAVNESPQTAEYNYKVQFVDQDDPLHMKTISCIAPTENDAKTIALTKLQKQDNSKTRWKFVKAKVSLLDEDAPANAVSGGGIAGMTPEDTPGPGARIRRKILRRKKKITDRIAGIHQ